MADEGATVATAPDAGKTAAEGTIATASDAGAATASGAPAPEGDKGTDGKPKDATGDKGKAEGAPEKYEAFKLPEGVEVDEAAMTEFSGVAKEMGLTQDAAQKLVDFHAKQMQSVAKSSEEAITALMTEWKDASKNDKEFGGANFDSNIDVAKKAIDAIFPVKEEATEFKAMLDATGVGNHKEFLRLMVRVGKLIGDDSIHRGAAPANQGQKPVTDRLFPEMARQQAAEAAA